MALLITNTPNPEERKMKLIVFGSTGGTGQQIVSQALQMGHIVTAFTASPDKMKQNHYGLQVVKGDVMESASVINAIQGNDAVFCLLGLPANNKNKLRANGSNIIIHAMKNAGITRLICLSAIGVGDSYALLPFHYKYFIIPLMLRHVYADHELQERYIKKSSLDWTIARAGALTDDKHTGHYKHGFSAEEKTVTFKISRADIADFMIQQLTSDSYLHKTPCVSY